MHLVVLVTSLAKFRDHRTADHNTLVDEQLFNLYRCHRAKATTTSAHVLWDEVAPPPHDDLPANFGKPCKGKPVPFQIFVRSFDSRTFDLWVSRQQLVAELQKQIADSFGISQELQRLF